jgi:DNA mismatch repair protein MutS
MKATGIAVLLAQAGSFVPADSMVLRPYDAAFSRIWNHDNVWAGLSSFAVEMTELRDILLSATERSLVLGDEVCSGTESMSATALVASTIEHLDAQRTHFMFATHLHDLMKVPGLFPRESVAVWHLRVQRTPEGKLIYDRTLQAGSGSCTYGLEVARAMGLPISLIERAHEVRRGLGGEAAANDAPKSLWNAAIQRKACEVCGCPIVRDLEVHHIQERAKGGGNQLRNLVVLCESCHDKHHAGEIQVGALVLTSDGMERSTVSLPKAAAKTKTKWTEEEMETILSTIQVHKGRPLTRTINALQEHGITITAAQLRKIM